MASAAAGSHVLAPITRQRERDQGAARGGVQSEHRPHARRDHESWPRRSGGSSWQAPEREPHRSRGRVAVQGKALLAVDEGASLVLAQTGILEAVTELVPEPEASTVAEFVGDLLPGVCIFLDKPSKHRVIFTRAYSARPRRARERPAEGRHEARRDTEQQERRGRRGR